MTYIIMMDPNRWHFRRKKQKNVNSPTYFVYGLRMLLGCLRRISFADCYHIQGTCKTRNVFSNCSCLHGVFLLLLKGTQPRHLVRSFTCSNGDVAWPTLILPEDPPPPTLVMHMINDCHVHYCLHRYVYAYV